MVSSGDPGVYGMAGIVLEVAAKEKTPVPVEIVPGVTAATAASAILGAPLSQRLCSHQPKRPVDALGKN